MRSGVFVGALPLLPLLALGLLGVALLGLPGVTKVIVLKAFSAVQELVL